MKTKRKYITPCIESIEMQTENSFMEWTSQSIDDKPTGDFGYEGEGGEGIEADSKKMGWDAWE